MKETGNHSEKRRVPRIEVDFPVTVTWGQKQYRWKAREFSEYGILLLSTRKELVGEEIRLSLSLDDTQPALNLVGVVAYTTDIGLGVRFKNVRPEAHITPKYYVLSRGIGAPKPQS